MQYTRLVYPNNKAEQFFGGINEQSQIVFSCHKLYFQHGIFIELPKHKNKLNKQNYAMNKAQPKYHVIVILCTL